MTTTDEARVTDEVIAREVAACREVADKFPNAATTWVHVIVALADRLAARDKVHDAQHALILEQDAELAKLRKERAEMVALLDSEDGAIDCDVIQFGRDGDCALLPEQPCWGHRRIALLTKLRTP